MAVLAQLGQLLEEAVNALKADGLIPPDVRPVIEIERPPQPEQGDYSTNVAMSTARHAAMPARRLAEEIVGRLPSMDQISKIEVAGPGFINFFLSDEWLFSTIAEIIASAEGFWRSAAGGGRKVQIEFVSANPTGPLHVGSGRNAAYGDALARLLEATGHRVQKEFYINDAGTQMHRFAGSLEAHYLRALGQDAQPPEGGYEGEYMQELGNQLAAREGEKLVGHLSEIRKWGLETVLAGHRKTLERFGVRFDSWFSEQSLHESGKVSEVLQRLEDSGHLYEKDGAVWFRATALGAPRDQVVMRSGEGGAPTYLGVDAAYLIDKVERGFDKLVYVWGADHHGNVAGLQAVATALGVQDKVEILLHQLVNFESGGKAVRMSRRKGTIVTLDELIDEVGPDAAKFTFLSRSIDMTLDFDLEAAKAESPENPVYYVQYQHARACSILRQAEVERSPDASQSNRPASLSLLSHEAEIQLMRRLCDFPQAVEEAAKLRAPHRLSNFCLSTASLFSAFYRDCRVMSEDQELTAARLLLVQAARRVLAGCLDLLGVTAPERMESRETPAPLQGV